MRSKRHGKSEIFLHSRLKICLTGNMGYFRVDLSHCAMDTKDIRLSALVDRNGFPLVYTVSPANIHDSQLYEPTLEALEIPEVHDRPTIISADAAYDAREIRQYNQKRGIKTNIPVNKRSRKHPKRGRPIRFDPELYKKRNAVERSLSWIEAFKKIVPRYKQYEHSFLGLIHLARVVMVGRILG
jgi:transposase